MNVSEHMETGQRYYWKRTEGWTWLDGETRWWEVSVEPLGFNGVGGLWLKEIWRWNGSSEDMRVSVRSLSREESEQLVEQVHEHIDQKETA